jgi:hypothetical protein
VLVEASLGIFRATPDAGNCTNDGVGACTGTLRLLPLPPGGSQGETLRLLRASATHACGLEIDASPSPPQLDACRAIATACRPSVGSAAHATEHLDFLRLGVLTARRGWAEADDLLNTAEPER